MHIDKLDENGAGLLAGEASKYRCLGRPGIRTKSEVCACCVMFNVQGFFPFIETDITYIQ